jgi:hypothetical protein
MDLNLKRRKRERAIALDVEDEFLREIKSAEQIAAPELLAHHFGLVCQRLDFIPSEAEANRVLAYASKTIARKRREVERVARLLPRD